MRTRIAKGAAAGLVAGIAMIHAPTPAKAQTKDFVSGSLQGRRTSELICTITNKSGMDIEWMMTIKAPDGTVLEGPMVCDPVANGESCTLVHDIVFPAYETAGYCHATVPVGKFVVGSLRWVDASGATRAESQMQVDLERLLLEVLETQELILDSLDPD